MNCFMLCVFYKVIKLYTSFTIKQEYGCIKRVYNTKHFIEILIYLLITANRMKEEEMSLKSYISSDFISSPILGSGVVLVILLFLYIVTGIEIFRIKFYSVIFTAIALQCQLTFVSAKLSLKLSLLVLECHSYSFKVLQY